MVIANEMSPRSQPKAREREKTNGPNVELAADDTPNASPMVEAANTLAGEVRRTGYINAPKFEKTSFVVVPLPFMTSVPDSFIHWVPAVCGNQDQ